MKGKGDHKEIVTVDLSDYVDLKNEPMKVLYAKSEQILKETKEDAKNKAEELNKRIEATYATLREMNDRFAKMTEERDRKLESATNRYYATLAAILGGFAIAFIYHIFGGA